MLLRRNAKYVKTCSVARSVTETNYYVPHHINTVKRLFDEAYNSLTPDTVMNSTMDHLLDGIACP